MYFDGTTLAALLSDPERAAASAPAIAAAGPRYTSPLAVIEAAMELPDLGEDELTAFLDAQKIELRSCPHQRAQADSTQAASKYSTSRSLVGRAWQARVNPASISHCSSE